MQTTWDSLWINATVVTCDNGDGFAKNMAIAVKDGHIAWIGLQSELPSTPSQLAEQVHDASKYCMTPGLIDCHTHIVYAGNRAHEFEQRLQGATYEDIAKRGGGIQSTVAATRAASEEELFQQSLPRVKTLMQSGVTTLEIKSGYGLDIETELKMLRVAKRIATVLPITIKTTFLGAHTVPVEYRGNPDHYIDLVCNEMMPAIANEKLADAVDVFCEKIAFTLEQTERVFKAAQQHKLAIKCHAEQLSDSGSATLAASYHALSVDHLEHVTEDGIKAMAASGTVAVLLPGAFYFLRETTLPPIHLLRKYAIPMALATDCNPGTSPIVSMLLILNMACTLFRLTPKEAWLGATKHAATALGLATSHGTLTVGKAADFVLWKVTDPVELVYYLGANPVHQIIKNGVIVV